MIDRFEWLQARAYFSKAVEREDKDPRSFFKYALFLEKCSNSEKAEQCYLQVLYRCSLSKSILPSSLLLYSYMYYIYTVYTLRAYTTHSTLYNTLHSLHSTHYTLYTLYTLQHSTRLHSLHSLHAYTPTLYYILQRSTRLQATHATLRTTHTHYALHEATLLFFLGTGSNVLRFCLFFVHTCIIFGWRQALEENIENSHILCTYADFLMFNYQCFAEVRPPPPHLSVCSACRVYVCMFSYVYVYIYIPLTIYKYIYNI